jgi:glycosyltransferase involved in cell wall biosynthesis
MRRIGVFALNISAKSGGSYGLIRGLMENACYSNNSFVYLCEAALQKYDFPRNVRLITRPALVRIMTQCLFHTPGTDMLLASRSGAVFALSTLTGVLPRIFNQVDAWLWPHCFAVVPRLPNTIAICHDMLHKHFPEYFDFAALSRRSLGEKSLQNCALILCPSRTTLNDLLLNYPELGPKAKIIPEAPCEMLSQQQCSDEIDNLRRSLADTASFLFVGVDWPHKNHRLLIQAAVTLRSLTDRPFRIIFAGRRRNKSIAQIIRKSQADDVVIDVGSIPRKKLAAYYSISTAFLFPSLFEGFGIPLVEAMHYGLPIIASNQSSTPEICGKAAVLLPPHSAQLWAEEMLRMMTDQIHRAAYSQLSCENAARFSWRQTWKELDSALASYL